MTKEVRGELALGSERGSLATFRNVLSHLPDGNYLMTRRDAILGTDCHLRKWQSREETLRGLDGIIQLLNSQPRVKKCTFLVASDILSWGFYYLQPDASWLISSYFSLSSPGLVHKVNPDMNANQHGLLGLPFVLFIFLAFEETLVFCFSVLTPTWIDVSEPKCDKRPSR